MILNGERSIYYSVGREIKKNELGHAWCGIQMEKG